MQSEMGKDKQMYAVPSCLFAGFLGGDEARQQVKRRIWSYLIFKLAGKLTDEAISNALDRLQLSAKDPRAAYREGQKIAEQLTTRSFYMISLPDLYKIVDGEHSEVFVRDWLAYQAIRSIEGKKNFMRITNKLWLARMDGKDRASSLAELSEEVRAISGRKTMYAMRERLYEHYTVVTYASAHMYGGYFVSTKLSVKELIERLERGWHAKVSKLAKAIAEAEGTIERGTP